MNELSKKLGYLRSLLDGKKKENGTDAVDECIYALLTSLVDRTEELTDRVNDTDEFIREIDDDLNDLMDAWEEDAWDELLTEESSEPRPGNLRLLRGNDNAGNDGDERLAGVLCPDCGKMFFIRMRDPEGSRYICPQCGKKISPEPLSPANTPIVDPVREN